MPTIATTSVVISILMFNTSLVRVVELLSIRAPAQISQILSCVSKGKQFFSSGLREGGSGGGCLCTAVLWGIDRSMPGVWCSSCERGDTVLFDSSLMRDVANIIRWCDGLGRKPIGDCILWVMTAMTYDVWAPSSHFVACYHY
jgi:hypothetical protein